MPDKNKNGPDPTPKQKPEPAQTPEPKQEETYPVLGTQVSSGGEGDYPVVHAHPGSAPTSTNPFANEEKSGVLYYAWNLFSVGELEEYVPPPYPGERPTYLRQGGVSIFPVPDFWTHPERTRCDVQYPRLREALNLAAPAAKLYMLSRIKRAPSGQIQTVPGTNVAQRILPGLLLYLFPYKQTANGPVIQPAKEDAEKLVARMIEVLGPWSNKLIDVVSNLKDRVPQVELLGQYQDVYRGEDQEYHKRPPLNIDTCILIAIASSAANSDGTVMWTNRRPARSAPPASQPVSPRNPSGYGGGPTPPTTPDGFAPSF